MHVLFGYTPSDYLVRTTQYRALVEVGWELVGVALH